MPIFGVRGLNNGLADAHNIGWKLAYVLSGLANERLLDSYSQERRGATLDVFANATKSTRFMTPPTRGWQLMREAALSLSLREAFPRELANPRQMQPHTYADSPLTDAASGDQDFAGGPGCGAFAPDARLADGTHLLDRAGDGFTLLTFGDPPNASFEPLKRLDPRLVALNVANNGGVAQRFDARPGTVYLLRPDLHVAGRWRSYDAGRVERALAICLGSAA